MEYYKKVFIKSKRDLPQASGEYFVGYKAQHTTATLFYLIGGDRLTDDPQYWIDVIDWYLLPVESPEITDEMIDEWADKTAIETTGKSKHGHIIKAALYTGAKWGISQINSRKELYRK